MSYKYKYNKKLVENARVVRKKQTDAEKLLWSKLRNRQLGGYKFRRQYPISKYIVDFYCAGSNLAVELDGSQHQSSTEYDTKRTKSLENLGITVIRFWNNDVFKNIDGVLEEILKNLTPTLS